MTSEIENYRQFFNNIKQQKEKISLVLDELYLHFMKDKIFKLLCKCEYCGKKFKSVENCNKHEEICKNKPTKTLNDFLKMVSSKEELMEIQQEGFLLCIQVIRSWNKYETREYLRPDNTIYVDVDPLRLRFVPEWIEKNEQYIKYFKKPLPQFRN